MTTMRGKGPSPSGRARYASRVRAPKGNVMECVLAWTASGIVMYVPSSQMWVYAPAGGNEPPAYGDEDCHPHVPPSSVCIEGSMPGMAGRREGGGLWWGA